MMFDETIFYLGRFVFDLPQRFVKVVFVPAGNRNTASSRLRMFSVFPSVYEISSTNWVGVDDLIVWWPEVVWFQKRLTPELVGLARILQKSGSLIIYDCDESGCDLDWWADPRLVREACGIADLVFVDTPERANYVGVLYSPKNVVVLENEIDYSSLNISACVSDRAESEVMRVLWFGNNANLRGIKQFADVFSENFSLRLVTVGAGYDNVSNAFPGLEVECHAWSESTFLPLLKSCDVTLLSHFGSRFDLNKSAHKMITSIAHGVPALVSSTPDYSRVAISAGVPKAIFSDAISLAGALDWVSSSDVRAKYIEQARGYILQRYAPGSFARAAIFALKDLLDQRKAGV